MLAEKPGSVHQNKHIIVPYPTACYGTMFSIYSFIRHLLNTYYVASPLPSVVTKLEIATCKLLTVR